jgi:hypothetical protein
MFGIGLAVIQCGGA